MADKDYFALFSLPLHLRLDTAALEKEFYAQSRRLHPDRFAAASESEQERALAASSRLNDAYRTLKDPILRTGYLLALQGVELEEQSRAATDVARSTGAEKKQVVPPELLEEVFELNMQLMELKSAREMGDAADPDLERDLQAAARTFRAKLAQTQTELESLWNRWDAAVDQDDDAAKISAREGMVALLNRRSYLRNLVRDVDSALEP